MKAKKIEKFTVEEENLAWIVATEMVLILTIKTQTSLPPLILFIQRELLHTRRQLPFFRRVSFAVRRAMRTEGCMMEIW